MTELQIGQPVLAVGQPMSRVDGPLKVTGRATYAAEYDVPGLVYGVIVNSTVSRGTITAIRSEAALSAPGVLRVLSDWSKVKLPYPTNQVNFFGQPVAVVVATTLEQAEHAASLVEVSYAPAPALTDFADRGAPTQPSRQSPDYSRGDPDRALRAAHTVVDQTFTIKRENHNPMELPSTIARWVGDQLTLWDKTQWVQGTARSVATGLGVPVANVRVISPFVGGAFGSAGMTWQHQILTAFVAREVGRPVKLVLNRRQMYVGIGYRPSSWQRLAMGSSAVGKITAVVHEARTETSRFQLYEDGITALPRFLYDSPAMRSLYRLVLLDVHQPTQMRGPGAVTGAFALESAMDELAHQLGIDPVQLRLRNEPAVDQVGNLPFSTRGLTECYQQGAQSFGWSQRGPVPRARTEGGLLVGMGMAAAAYHTTRLAADASARINDDGTAVVASATTDMGPGTYTSMTQVAADALGLPTSRITFQLGDSTLPKAPAQAGSWTMASVGSAVFTACNSLRDSMVRTAVVDPASPLHGATSEQVSVRDGSLYLTNSPERLTRGGPRWP